MAQDPHYADPCVRAAYIQYELDESPKAGEYLNRCQSALRTSGPLLQMKAQALQELVQDYAASAMELFQLIVDRYPQDTDALYHFSELATDSNRLDEADRAIGTCLKIEPTNVYCLFQFMFVRIKQNRFSDVLNTYKALSPSLRSYPWFDEALGIALLADGQVD